MVAMYPMGPIMDGGALNMTVMSYMGSVYFGLVADRDAVPQVWDIARNVDTALVELKKAADQTSAKPKAKSKAAGKAQTAS
jgi:hypothetical protein